MPPEDRPFLRLWHGFLTGRVMVALALLALQVLGQALSQNTQKFEMAVTLAYLADCMTLLPLAICQRTMLS